jgi:HEPN superfamily protein
MNAVTEVGAGSGARDRSAGQVRPDRARCRIAPSVLALLDSARAGLASAQHDGSAAGRYVGAHLAALRAAAAIVAARAEPAPRRSRPRSVWELLPRVEPTLSEWAAFFAAGAGKRAAAEAGLPRAVSAREADELLRDAMTFVSLAESALGAPAQSPLPLLAAI